MFSALRHGLKLLAKVSYTCGGGGILGSEPPQRLCMWHVPVRPIPSSTDFVAIGLVATEVVLSSGRFWRP